MSWVMNKVGQVHFIPLYLGRGCGNSPGAAFMGRVRYPHKLSVGRVGWTRYRYPILDFCQALACFVVLTCCVLVAPGMVQGSQQCEAGIIGPLMYRCTYRYSLVEASPSTQLHMLLM